MSKLESEQKSVIINHISINKLNTLIYVTISDFLSDKSVHEIYIQNRVLLSEVYGNVRTGAHASLQAAIFSNSVC